MVFIAVPLAFILLCAVCRIPFVGASTCSPPSDSWIVTDEDDALNLAFALRCSDGNFTVTWAGVIAVSETLAIADGTSLTITGEGTDSGLDGTGTTGPLIFVEGGSSTLTLRNLEITNGSGWNGGAIYALTSATVIITNSSFSHNDANGDGGAIHAGIGVTLRIDGNTVFHRNTAFAYGGAISIADTGNLTVDGISKFSSNSAITGGAIYATGSSLVTIDGLTNFTGNTASSHGGALYVSDDASLDINGQAVMFVYNTAGVEGGAIGMFSSEGSATINIRGITKFTNNSAGTSGGAVFIDNALLVIVTGVMTLEGNSAPGGFGGGLYVARTIKMEVSRGYFRSNSAAFGGAIASLSSGLPSHPILYSECAFTENYAEKDGGAIYSVASYDALSTVEMDGNFAGGSGGAVVHSGEISALIDVTFSNNLAGGDGPAVLSLGSIVGMANYTFTGNSFFCEPGTYLEEVEEGCFLDVVCSGCLLECVDSAAVGTERLVPSCTVTPEHTTTLEPGGTVASLVLEKGFYRVSSESLSILECLNGDACVGGSVAGQYCAEGYSGPYCAVCMEDYASGYSYSCKACRKTTSQAINAVLIIGLTVFIVLLIVVIQYLIATIPPATGDSGHDVPALQTGQSEIWVRSATKHLLGTVKIVLVVWQITTQFTSITGTTYSGIYQDFIQGIGVLDFDRGLILSSSCLIQSNFYDRLIVSTCFPFVVVSLLTITRLIALKRNNRSSRVVAEIDNRHLSTLLVVVLLIYSTTSTTIFETFGCDSVDDGVEFLRADYRLECNTREHRIYKVFAAVMIVVYPVGIPLCLGWWLFVNRHALRGQLGTEEGSGHLAPFKELWEPYKPERYYWEIVEFIRRIFLTGIGVLIFPNSATQIAVILLLAAFFGVVFEVLDPYRDSRDTWLYRTGYVVVLLSVYLALLLRLYLSNDRSPSQDAFSTLLVVLHCMMILSVVTESLGLACDAYRKMRVV